MPYVNKHSPGILVITRAVIFWKNIDKFIQLVDIDAFFDSKPKWKNELNFKNNIQYQWAVDDRLAITNLNIFTIKKFKRVREFYNS